MHYFSSAVPIFSVICVATFRVTSIEGALTTLGSADGVTVSTDLEYSGGSWQGAAQTCRLAGLTIADKVLTSEAVQELIYDSVASTVVNPYYWTSRREAGADGMCTVLHSLQGSAQSFPTYKCGEISARTICEKSDLNNQTGR